jgi:phage portal protein BeeE
LDGQYYIWKEKVIGRYFYWVVPPSQVTKRGEFYALFGRFVIPKEDILHYRDFVPNYMVYDNTVCLSPIEVAGINLRVIDYASAANYKTLKGGAVQGVAYEKPLLGDRETDPTQLKELRDLLVSRYNTPESHGEVTIISKEIGYTAFGLKPSELMILENILFNEERICDIFNYPRILLGDKGGTLGGNIRTEAKKEFILDAVFPVLSIIVQSLTRLFELQDQNITWDRDAFPELQMDWVTTSQALDRMWYLQPNEKRKVLGYEPDPQFEGVYFMPNNITTLDEVLAGGTSVEDELPNDGDFN